MASGCESEELFVSGPEDDYFPQNQEELYLPSDTQSQEVMEEGHEQSGESSDEVSENDHVPKWYYDSVGIAPAKRRKVRPCQDDCGKKSDGIKGSTQPRVSFTRSPGQGHSESLTQTPSNPKHSQRQDGEGPSHSRLQRHDSRQIQLQNGGGLSHGPSQRDDSRRTHVQRQDGGGPSRHSPSQRDDSMRTHVQRQDNGGPSRVQTPKRGSEGELSEIKLLLNSLCESVKENSRCLKQLQVASEKQRSSSDTSSKEIRKIPAAVRAEVRRTYQVLLDGENFPGWLTGSGATIKDPQNQEILSKLIKEVKSLNQSFDVVDIRSAACRFYRSRSEEESRQRRGIAEHQKLVKRRHERIMRKKKERSAAVMRNKKLTEEKKDKWLSVITSEFMSSEESGPDDEIYVNPIPWRSDYVTRMFGVIDAYVQDKKSPQAKRQMKKRCVGLASERSMPVDAPDWAVNAE